MSISRLSLLYIVGDILLIIISIFASKYWLINTQLAFISSMLITFASYFSYKIMIEKSVKDGNINEKRDSYDEIEDPYMLFDDEIDEVSVAPKIEPKEEEGGKLNGIIKGLVVGLSGALSVYRAIAYIFLFLVILFLIRHEIFNAIAFFAGLSVVPLLSLLSSMFKY